MIEVNIIIIHSLLATASFLDKYDCILESSVAYQVTLNSVVSHTFTTLSQGVGTTVPLLFDIF